MYELDKFSHDDSQKKWQKSLFEIVIKNIYDMKSLNDMNYIYYNKVNIISECNLLHGILNHYKCTKNINSHYFPIIHGCMNTHSVRAKYNNLQIILDSGCIYMVIIRSIEIKFKA